MGLGPMILCVVLGAGGFFTMYYVAATVTLIALPVYWLYWGRSGEKGRMISLRPLKGDVN